MRTLAIVLSCAALLALALVLVFTLRADVSGASVVAESSSAERIEALAARVDELARRMEALERRPAPVLDRGQDREPARASTASVPAPDAPREHDAAWFLEQYVASFDANGEGSEYFRLIVDAYVAELVEPVASLVADSSRPLGLRIALAHMLGKPRFAGDARVLGALARTLHACEHESLSLAVVAAWKRIGDVEASPRIEAILWQLAPQSVLDAAVRALLAIAGERSNQVLVRLLQSAPTEADACRLVALLDGADLEAALAFFQRAAQREQPVRLAAAKRIGGFGEPPFQQFVEAWLRVETDAQVIEALRGAREEQRTVPGWAPMQATGAPDADPKRDDPKAWAPRDPEMGVQWLQLEFAAADRVTGVDVYETCAPGAVAEVRARGPGGDWVLLWSGQANSGGAGPLEVRFAPTTFRTQTLRVVLDTNRTSGWNEIDAVALVGLGGNQWAAGASASSTYAQRAGAVQGLQFGEFRGLTKER